MNLYDVLTAVVLSPNDVITVDTRGLNTLLYTNKFNAAHSLTSQLHHYRKRSVFLPTTKYMCWIDDDDALPENIVDVCTRLISRMEEHGHYIGYTNEMVIHSNGQRDAIPKKAYSRYLYEEQPINVMHHLVIMNTQQSQFVAGYLPEGIHWVEYLFNLYLAELGGGATHLDEIGYIWNRTDNPRNLHSDYANGNTRINSYKWGKENLPCR